MVVPLTVDDVRQILAARMTVRELLWLEGGPAYSLGQTHPCCFNPDAVTDMALSRQPGSLDR